MDIFLILERLLKPDMLWRKRQILPFSFSSKECLGGTLKSVSNLLF